MDSIYKELFKKHGDSGVYSCPQLRLWARMIQCGTHEDYDDPPRVPQITGLIKKPVKNESLSEALAGAAVAVAKAFTPQQSTPEHTLSKGSSISPGKSVELRMKNLEQLKFLQQLRDDCILSQAEFVEQKTIILEALRKLN